MGFAVTRTYPDVKEVVVIKVKYENFLKSLCDAFKSGVFLWGLRMRVSVIKCLRSQVV
jgi:hypothetical protein